MESAILPCYYKKNENCTEFWHMGMLLLQSAVKKGKKHGIF